MSAFDKDRFEIDSACRSKRFGKKLSKCPQKTISLCCPSTRAVRAWLPDVARRSAERSVLRRRASRFTGNAGRPAGAVGFLSPSDHLFGAAVSAHAFRRPPDRRSSPFARIARDLRLQPVSGPKREEGDLRRSHPSRRAGRLDHRACLNGAGRYAVRQRRDDPPRRRKRRRQKRNARAGPSRTRRAVALGPQCSHQRKASSHASACMRAASGDRRHGLVPSFAATNAGKAFGYRC